MLRSAWIRFQPTAARVGRTAVACSRARLSAAAVRPAVAHARIAAAQSDATRALHAAAAPARRTVAPTVSAADRVSVALPPTTRAGVNVLLFGRTYSRAGARAFCTSQQRHSHSDGGSGYSAGASNTRVRMAGAAAGLTALMAFALTDGQSPAQAAAASRPPVIPASQLPDKIAFESESVTADRLSATYGYVGGALALTSVAAWASYASGLAAYMLTLNPWTLLGATLVSSIGLLFATRYVSYSHSPYLKHALWLGFSAAMGASLGVVGFYSSQLVLRAAVGTAAVVGTLSVVGAASPTGTWRWLHAPLTVGLGVMLGAGLGQMWWPDSSALNNIMLYGSLAIYGAFVVADTNRLMERARMDPLDLTAEYDPINESLQLYINSINTFLSLLSLLDELENPRRRYRRDRSGPTLEPA